MNRIRHRAWTLVAITVVLVLTSVSTLAWAYDGKFDDVEPDNVFWDDIGWMADVGVTKGCNPPENDLFCPKNYVTREQMAAFMHRLSENVVFGPLRNNQTDRGVWAVDESWGLMSFVAITFPRRLQWGAPTVLVVEEGQGPTGPCEGTVDQPEAAVETLCVYVDAAVNVDSINAWRTYPFGVVLEVHAVGDGWMGANGTWAVGGPERRRTSRRRRDQ